MSNSPENFRNKEITKNLIKRLQKRLQKFNSLRVMEFCGTHTHNIFQYGFRYLFQPHLKFIAGPGCPVCVTSDYELAQAFYLLKKYDVGIITYGDLLKVPYNGKSLLDFRSDGYSIGIVYSALEAISIAEKESERKWVFLGVGFETTMPATSALLDMVIKKNIKNLTVLSFHKNTKSIISTLGSIGELKVDGIFLPGHVSAVVGWKYFEDINVFEIPAVVVGFEPVDIIHGLYELIDMIENREKGIKCCYKRAVKEDGNEKMLKSIERCFDIVDCSWRGLGVIKNGGYEIKKEYEEFNAKERFNFKDFYFFENKSQCMCGDVLIGKIEPIQCPSFDMSCNPDTPMGPCMVSHEGTCLAYYKWSRLNG